MRYSFEDLAHYKQEDNFKRCLSKLTVDDVKAAILRADFITANNEKDGKILLQYKTYRYYRDNPALSIRDIVRRMLTECGLFLKEELHS